MTDKRQTGYRQCKLQRDGREKVVWIPERFATKGAYLRLFDEDRWRVVEVFMFLPTLPTLNHGYFAGGIFHQ